MFIVGMTLCWSLSNCSGRMLWWRTWLYLTVIQIWEVVGQCKFLKLDELEENEQMNTFFICVVVLTESHCSFIFKICSTELWIFLSVYLEDWPPHPTVEWDSEKMWWVGREAKDWDSLSSTYTSTIVAWLWILGHCLWLCLNKALLGWTMAIVTETVARRK